MVYFIVHILFEPCLPNVVDVYMNMKYLFLIMIHTNKTPKEISKTLKE
jgi:hypothetical protein